MDAAPVPEGNPSGTGAAEKHKTINKFLVVHNCISIAAYCGNATIVRWANTKFTDVYLL